MIHLNFSICGDERQNNAVLQELLSTFEKESLVSIRVDVHPLSWETYRQELTSMVIHDRRGDVAQAGAPVASDMAAMNALRPFRPREVEQMGGESAFMAVAWRNTPPKMDGQVWAIPWLADPRIFLYWRDLLEQAQVNEKSAFESPQGLIAAAEKLQAIGISKPWGITVGTKHSALHTVANWVWACGGEFISEDEKEALILEPAALEGLKAYFSMARFMAPETLSASYEVNNQAFADRKTAIIVGNAETFRYIVERIAPEMRSRLGAALPFGAPLVGGSDLMIWAGTSNEESAVRLVQFLTDSRAQAAYPISIDHLPVRADVLREPPFTTDPILQVFAQALQCGRVFPIVKLSGLFEDGLGNALVNTWRALFADPSVDLEELITQNLAPVARRYNNWMAE